VGFRPAQAHLFAAAGSAFTRQESER
jgi:hypothetical protein